MTNLPAVKPDEVLGFQTGVAFSIFSITSPLKMSSRVI